VPAASAGRSSGSSLASPWSPAAACVRDALDEDLPGHGRIVPTDVRRVPLSPYPRSTRRRALRRTEMVRAA
jgi:hypothetical protein